MRDSVSRDAGTPPETHSHQNANLVSSFRFAFVGFTHVLKTQRNMRIHLSVAVAVIALGLYLGLDWLQWAVLCMAIGSVIVAEMFNTVAEAALDAATANYHPLVKVAKDTAAGAVLVTAIVSFIVGLLVLGPPLLLKIAS